MTDLDALKKQAFDLLGTGNAFQAEKLLRSIKKLDDVAADPSPSENADTQARHGLLLALNGLSLLLQNKTDKARTSLEEAQRLLEQALPSLEGESAVSTRIDLVFTLTALARTLLLQQQLLESTAMADEAEKLLAQSLPENDARTASVLFTLSMSAYVSRALNKAEERLLRAMEIWKALYGEDCPERAVCLNNLGRICEESDRLEEGIAWHRAALAMKKKVLGTHPETAFSLGNLGTALASAGQWKEAAALLDEALACYAACGQTSGPHIDGYRRNRDICLQALNEA